jgi:pyrroline-5-carboxylate reductase
MIVNTVGFIGGGRVVRIILGGWRRAGVFPPEVIVSEPGVDAAEKLKSCFPEARITADLPGLLGQVKHVFVAVHPPAVPDALTALAGKLRPDSMVVSLAPKVSIARLASLLGGFERIVRTIPNAASLVGAGYNPVAFGAALREAEKEQVLALLRPLGACPMVLEAHLEAYAVLTAMGPTYFWFQFQELQELGRSFGLPATDVDAGLAGMVKGSAQTFFESGCSPEEVMDLVPVRPLQDEETTIRAAYRTCLSSLYQKLKG